MQVADFGDPEPEWSVERILSHSGSGTDAVFEVKWTSGDVTWLPYLYIGQLTALNEYLERLDLTDIRDLPEGGGRPPSDNPQVFIGVCFLEDYPSNTPTSRIHQSDSHNMVRDDLSRSRNISLQGDDFVFKDAAGTGTFLVPRWHLHLCL